MLSRSDDPVDAALTAAVDAVLVALRRIDSDAPVVLIDGRSGAGKTTLAARLSERMPDADVIALDSLYPGWDGLAAGAKAVREGILEPHRARRDGVWHRWDWTADQPAEAHVVPPLRALIIEGSGVLTPDSARLADVTVWLESPEASRKRRALDRDGDGYRPHWERWARQEREHLAADHPALLADVHIEVP